MISNSDTKDRNNRVPGDSKFSFNLNTNSNTNSNSNFNKKFILNNNKTVNINTNTVTLLDEFKKRKENLYKYIFKYYFIENQQGFIWMIK